MKFRTILTNPKCENKLLHSTHSSCTVQFDTHRYTLAQEEKKQYFNLKGRKKKAIRAKTHVNYAIQPNFGSIENDKGN